MQDARPGRQRMDPDANAAVSTPCTGRTGTSTGLLSKATDAKPKHSVPRLRRLLQTSQAERQLKALCTYKMHTKLFFPSVHSRQFASCRRFCCHCYCSAFGSLDMGDGDMSSSPQTLSDSLTAGPCTPRSQSRRNPFGHTNVCL